VVLDPLIVNRDDIPKRTQCSLVHGGAFSLSWLRSATSSSARFGAASPPQLCETFPTSSGLMLKIDAIAKTGSISEFFTGDSNNKE
jgi:hypothetical protein